MRVFHIATCVHGHSSFCCAPPRKVWLSVTIHHIVKMENLLSCLSFPQLSLLFFTLSKPCCFNISSYILCSTCLTIVMEFHCTCCLTNHILQLAGQPFTNTAQDVVALLCSKDTLLTCVQVDVHQDCEIYCWKTTFYPVSSQPVLFPFVSPPQVQELIFAFLELRGVSSCPFL